MATWTSGKTEIVMATANAKCPPRAKLTREVVEAATARAVRGRWSSPLPCVGEKGGRPCGNVLDIELSEDGLEVRWWCSWCGDDGVVTGFAGTAADLRGQRGWGRTVAWAMLPEERYLLHRATVRDRAMRAVVARAHSLDETTVDPDDEASDMLLVAATVGELNDLYTLVESLYSGAVSADEREILDGLRASLSTSIDGF